MNIQTVTVHSLSDTVIQSLKTIITESLKDLDSRISTLESNSLQVGKTIELKPTSILKVVSSFVLPIPDPTVGEFVELRIETDSGTKDIVPAISGGGPNEELAWSIGNVPSTTSDPIDFDIISIK